MILQELKLRNYPYKSRHRLSERIVRNHFLKSGFEVFRGTSILGAEQSMYYDLYPNVRKKIDRLERILLGKIGLKLWILRNIVSNGIPDYFIHKNGKSFFVEVKLEHESIKKNQLNCMQLLENFGFDIFIIRVKENPYRIKSVVKVTDERLNILKVLVKQERLRKRYKIISSSNASSVSACTHNSSDAPDAT